MEDVKDIGFCVADAGKVRDGVEGVGSFEFDDEVVGVLAGGAAGPVGDADEGGPEGLELEDGMVEGVGAFGCFWWKELEGECGFIACEDVLDVHAGRLVFLGGYPLGGGGVCEGFCGGWRFGAGTF